MSTKARYLSASILPPLGLVCIVLPIASLQETALFWFVGAGPPYTLVVFCIGTLWAFANDIDHPTARQVLTISVSSSIVSYVLISLSMFLLSLGYL